MRSSVAGVHVRVCVRVCVCVCVCAGLSRNTFIHPHTVTVGKTHAPRCPSLVCRYIHAVCIRGKRNQIHYRDLQLPSLSPLAKSLSLTIFVCSQLHGDHVRPGPCLTHGQRSHMLTGNELHTPGRGMVGRREGSRTEIKIEIDI